MEDIIRKAKAEFLKDRAVRFSVEWQMRRFGINEKEAKDKILKMRKSYSTTHNTYSVE